ncbi:MAG: energy-dependent translational throttle protein EttA, partial [Myxococcota bacterium]
ASKSASGSAKASLTASKRSSRSWIDPEATVGYLAQEPKLDPTLTVRGNIELGLKPIKDLLERFDAVNEAFADPDADFDALIAEQGDLQDKIDAANGWELDRTIEIAMDALRVPDGEGSVEHLSGGEARRVALCQLLLQRPDLLLLDEPTNHLDAETVAWLERALREYHGTVIVVTHDRYFLDNVTGWVLELDNGKGVPFEGNYSSWLDQKLERLAKQGKQESTQARVLRQERDWVKMSQQDRRTQRNARLDQYDELLRTSGRRDQEIIIPPGPRLGDLVIETNGLSKGFGDRLLIDDLSFSLPRGGIVGIIGPNGAGKSTLFKMLTQQEEPGNGTIRLGDTVSIASMNQMRTELDPDRSVWENISGGSDQLLVDGREMNSRAYVGAFGFKGASQQQKVGTLSGGERNRVQLAKVLLQGGNVLLLDEPSNDLDVATLRALEDALLAFPGCAVVISHDRWFLDRVATHILAFEGNSHVEWFAGNYQEYEKDRRKRFGEDADQPRRIKYKPIRR